MLKEPGRTKRTAARLALVAAIRSGLLGPGSLLPSEKSLTTMLGVSLGTVQAALRQLQDTGIIVRRRGDGTRVASAEPLSQSVWHFRFLDVATMRPVRFVAQSVDIYATDAGGPWAEFLDGAERFVCIARRLEMADGRTVVAEMFLDERSVEGLLATDPEELDMINIRPYLDEVFGLRVVRANHRVQTTRLSRRVANEKGLEAGVTYFEIQARAVTAQDTPVYFQRIFAQASCYALDF